jgi:hypothetical protein
MNVTVIFFMFVGLVALVAWLGERARTYKKGYEGLKAQAESWVSLEADLLHAREQYLYARNEYQALEARLEATDRHLEARNRELLAKTQELRDTRDLLNKVRGELDQLRRESLLPPEAQHGSMNRTMGDEPITVQIHSRDAQLAAAKGGDIKRAWDERNGAPGDEHYPTGINPIKWGTLDQLALGLVDHDENGEEIEHNGEPRPQREPWSRPVR